MNKYFHFIINRSRHMPDNNQQQRGCVTFLMGSTETNAMRYTGPESSIMAVKVIAVYQNSLPIPAVVKIDL